MRKQIIQLHKKSSALMLARKTEVATRRYVQESRLQEQPANSLRLHVHPASIRLQCVPAYGDC